MKKSDADRLAARLQELEALPCKVAPIIDEKTPHQVLVLTSHDGKPRWSRFRDTAELEDFIDRLTLDRETQRPWFYHPDYQETLRLSSARSRGGGKDALKSMEDVLTFAATFFSDEELEAILESAIAAKGKHLSWEDTKRLYDWAWRTALHQITLEHAIAGTVGVWVDESGDLQREPLGVS